MNLNELTEKYQNDVKVNQLNLEEEVQKSAKLHAEYIGYWSLERQKYYTLLRQMKQLRLAKDEFYSQGPSKETERLGWKYPGGVILKTKIPTYIDADEQVLELQEKLDEAQIKFEALQEMVQALKYRSNQINMILSIRKWEGGE